MAFVIKNNDKKVGYYTGQSWEPTADNAQQFATEEFAEAIIKQHRMDATVEKVKEEKQPRRDGK